MNITITGNLGSGKSSVCKELEASGFTIISAGDIFRQLAQEKGMTVIELNEAAKKDRSIDDMLDARSTQLGKTMDHTVFDSRLAWHFVEKSFKVFLLVDTQEAARRVYEGNSRSAEEYRDIAQARHGLEERARLEQERFFKLYGLDYYDVCNYDLVIESTCATPQQLAQEIVRNFTLYQKQPFSTRIELNLKCLYPSVTFDQISADRLEQICQAGRAEPETLCARDAVTVMEQDGYYYLETGHHQAFAAAAAGKVFAEVQSIRTVQDTAVKLSDSDLAQFEQAGKFHYPVRPMQTPHKAAYMIDVSKQTQTC